MAAELKDTKPALVPYHPVNLPINAMGRPRKLNNPRQMLADGLKYLRDCDAAGEPYLVTGLALALGFNGRKQLHEYMAYDDFNPILKRLLTIVEGNYERLSLKGNPAGPIFVLKNMGWSDRTEITGANGEAIKLDTRFEIVLHSPKANHIKQIRD